MNFIERVKSVLGRDINNVQVNSVDTEKEWNKFQQQQLLIRLEIENEAKQITEDFNMSMYIMDVASKNVDKYIAHKNSKNNPSISCDLLFTKVYTIYHKETARYKDANIGELIKKQTTKQLNKLRENISWL